MSVRFPLESRRIELSITLGNSPSEDLILRLFKNDLRMTDDLTLSSFVQADFLGYKEMPLNAKAWQFDREMPTTAEHPMVEAISVADNQEQAVYGYYVVGVTSQRLRWCERFPEPYTIQNTGDRIQVVPVIDQAASSLFNI